MQLKIMTNEEKVKEIACQLFEDGHFHHNGISQRKEIEKTIMEMVQWKEQQMIDKAVEWLKSNCTYNDNGVEKCIVNLGFFIDVMKEE